MHQARLGVDGLLPALFQQLLEQVGRLPRLVSQPLWIVLPREYTLSCVSMAFWNAAATETLDSPAVSTATAYGWSGAPDITETWPTRRVTPLPV